MNLDAQITTCFQMFSVFFTIHEFLELDQTEAEVGVEFLLDPAVRIRILRCWASSGVWGGMPARP